ncbi:hypothetical protein RhiirA1_470552 [Rhizophagus irregularis]|uniref:Uncharacterized protein n=1 Tax=Rhizophagus irregularis TaxID=588596 RepID=A0A2N0R5Z0_9GLOM|nr:hypothetical protein RhiirA1_470552 [Rhizophagus irregularis]CAB4479617.1 unnamed protein product [Rhizophagus irregularis]CAB5364743.1 unnamed protein product [Rhizophagus irregularis]
MEETYTFAVVPIAKQQIFFLVKRRRVKETLCDVTNDLVINNGSIQNIEEIKDGELIFAELETYLYEAKKIGIEQHQAKN